MWCRGRDLNPCITKNRILSPAPFPSLATPACQDPTTLAFIIVFHRRKLSSNHGAAGALHHERIFTIRFRPFLASLLRRSKPFFS